jgi:hypothetical protein
MCAIIHLYFDSGRLYHANSVTISLLQSPPPPPLSPTRLHLGCFMSSEQKLHMDNEALLEQPANQPDLENHDGRWDAGPRCSL